MSLIDSENIYSAPGVSSVLTSLSLFPSQVEQSWSEIQKIKLSPALKSAKNIILLGMGGSALPGDVLKDLEFDLLKTPLEVVRGYHLPGYVNQDTLVILSSYSGDTEEVLSAASEAIKKTNKIFVFSTGGRLTDFARKLGISFYDPTPIFNPSNLPRLSLGYSLTTLIALLARLNLIKLNSRSITSLVNILKDTDQKYLTSRPLGGNPAKKLALSLNNRLPVLVGSSHLVGAVITGRNMLHETGKTFAVSYPIPELNHHLLESLDFPPTVTSKITFVFFYSRRYHPEIKRRIKLTSAVLTKKRIPWEIFNINGASTLQDVYLVIQLCGYLSLYLAALYGVDPGATVWVDWFKKRLKA